MSRFAQIHHSAVIFIKNDIIHICHFLHKHITLLLFLLRITLFTYVTFCTNTSLCCYFCKEKHHSRMSLFAQTHHSVVIFAKKNIIHVCHFLQKHVTLLLFLLRMTLFTYVTFCTNTSLCCYFC